MRFWMTGAFAGALTGFIWLGLWQLVLSMTAILTTGVVLPLQPGPAAIAGLMTALFGIAQRPAAPPQKLDLVVHLIFDCEHL